MTLRSSMHMQRRTKLALLILIGLLLLLLGLYLILSPFLARKATTAPGQEYSVPTAAAPAKPKAAAQKYVSGAPPTSTPAATANPATADVQRSLENRAGASVERMGSGSSQTGFQGYGDVMLDATDSFKTELVKEQQTMVQAHPPTGPLYGLSTRAVASHLTQGKPGDDKVQVTVQAIQTQDTGNPRIPSGKSGKQVVVTFARQSDGSYLIDGMQWSDLKL